MSYSYAPQNERADALFRVALLLVWTWTIWPIVLTTGLVGGIVFMMIDVILQLIRGDTGYNASNSMLAMWTKRLFRYPFDQLWYIIGIKIDRFPVLP